MGKNIQVSVSILCADFMRLDDEIKKCERAGVDRLHIDVMDGHFVPVITIGPILVEAIRPKTKLPIDAHLMVENPGAYIQQFIQAGADSIYVHAECYGPLRAGCRDFGQFPKEVDAINPDLARKDIKQIKAAGKKAFMVINPGTPLCIEPLLKEIDGVLIMSVNPGFAGQKFMPGALPKLKELRARFDGDIAIDGGVNEQTAPDCVKAGANILATASYFFRAEDPKKVIQYLKSLR